MKQIFTILTFLFIATSAFGQELSLEDCITIALENNISLEQQKNNLDAAEYDVLGGYSGIMPSLDVQARIGHTYTSKGITFTQIQVEDSNTNEVTFINQKVPYEKRETDNYNWSASLNQTIFDGFAWSDRIKKGYVDKDIANYTYLDRLNNVIQTVQANFYNLIMQSKLYDVNKIAVERSESQLALTEKMFSLGSNAKLDVFQAKVNLGNDKINLLSQKNIVSDARRLLNLSIGRDPSNVMEIKTIEFGYVDVSSVTDMKQTASENQPLLKRSKAQVKSNSISTSLSQSGYYPRISGSASYSRFSGFEFEKLYSDLDLNYQLSYGLNLSWNIFNGMSDHVNVQKSKIAVKNANLAEQDYNRRLNSAIQGLADNYKSYGEIIEINEGNLEAANEELRLAEERYKIGAGTTLDVREAQVKLTRAEQTLIAAQYSALTTLADLDYQLGLSHKKLNN